MWSESRSGQKIIALSRLTRVIEDRFARDARARDQQIQEARRLYNAAMAAAAAVETPDASDSPAGLKSTPEGSVSGPGTDGAPVGGASGLSADNPPASPDAGPMSSTDGLPTVPPEQLVSRPPAGPGRRPAGRLSRWRPPAQWAALAALVTVLVIANRSDHAKDPSTEEPSQQGMGQERPASTESGPAPSGSAASEQSQPPPGTPSDGAPSVSVLPDPAVTIDKPTDDTVPRCIDISGQGQPVEGHHLWISVRVDNEYFILKPVRQDSTDGAGRWSAYPRRTLIVAGLSQPGSFVHRQ